MIVTKTGNTAINLTSVDDLIIMSETNQSFIENVSLYMTKENIRDIEILTRGQSSSGSWYLHRKNVITASKGHGVLSKMDKIAKGNENVNLWSLNQKIAGLTFVNPNVPALKYGRTMEEEAVNTFANIMKKTHKDFKAEECGLFLHFRFPFIGASPDRMLSCSCCPPSCLEVKCPYSINYTSPDDPSVKLPYLLREGDKLQIIRKHKYFTQCLMQMAVTGCEKTYFVVWTPRGIVIDTVTFDNELWVSMQEKFTQYYMDFYLRRNSMDLAQSS